MHARRSVPQAPEGDRPHLLAAPIARGQEPQHAEALGPDATDNPHAHVLSVNVGLPAPATWARRRDQSAIDKRPVEAAAVSAAGLTGDGYAEQRFHGGPDRAVYAFSREEQHYWSRQLGRAVAPGSFGENLTVVEFDVDQAVLGEHWRVGEVLLEVADVRTPCAVFQNWIGVHHPDAHDWLKEFTARARPGAFLRVLETGTLRRGDPLHVVSRPAQSMSVSAVFTALTTQRQLLPRLLDVPGLAESRRSTATEYAARNAVQPTAPGT